jgi:hypothetical protein
VNPGALSWERARAVAGRTEPMAPVAARLEQAVGAVLAGDVRAPAGLPAAVTAAMDGFAVSGPGPWRVTGRVLAGQVRPGALRDGEAVEIATGAAVPPGADAVVRHEDADCSDGTVTGPAERGKNIRAAGSDFQAGQLLIASGTRLTALMAGLAASAGCDHVRVRPRPRVGVVLTGGEVRTSGLPSATATRDALGPAVTGLRFPDWALAPLSAIAVVPLFLSIAVTKGLVCETWFGFHAAAPPENRPFSRSACTHGPLPLQPPNQHSVLKLIASIAPFPSASWFVSVFP